MSIRANKRIHSQTVLETSHPLISLKLTDNEDYLRILHVDDDPSMREISKQILMDMNSHFEFDSAGCVDEAFKKLSTGHYDVVVSDYEMPQKDGLQFLKELREQNNTIPFILFTGKGREEVAIKALNLGADGYINKQGYPETVYGELAHNITLIVESYKARENLLEQDIRFAKLAAQTPGMLFQFLKRPDGTYCVPFTSEGICNIFGCSPQDVKEDFSPITKVIVPEDMERVIGSIEYSAAHISLWQCEYRVQLPGQKIRWLWGQSMPERLEDGSILWSGYNTDITERKNTEEKLMGSLEVLERVGEGVDAGLAVISKDYYVVWANKRLLDLGVAPNKKCYQTFNRLKTICPDCGVKKIFEDNVPLDVHEYKTVNAQGETIWVELRVTPLSDKDGNVTAALELAVPITERKKAEVELSDKEKRFRAIFDKSFQFALLLDINGNVVEMNDLCYTVHGPLAEGCLGKPFWEAAWWSQFPEVAEKTKLAIQSCQVGKIVQDEVKFFDKNLQIHHGVRIFSPILDENGKLLYISVVGLDISERKKAEDALADSEAKYRALVENADDTILLTDLSGKSLYKNRAYLKNLGFEEDEDAQAEKVARIHPDDLQSVKDKGSELSKTGYSTSEYRVKHRSGSWVYRYAKSTLLCNASHQPYAILSIIRDITERKLAEEKIKESSQRIELMNEKLRVVGGLTMHDVRNKLSTVTGYAYLLKKKHSDQADIMEGLSKMEQAVKETVRIFDFAKMYEQLGAEELTYIDVEAKLNEATTLFSGSLPKIINECHGLTVLADSFLRQLFYNFIDDTRKYGQKTTSIRVHYEKADQDSLKLVYEDDGVGIPLENKQNLFKEGFSTGFGLFLTKKMMDVYGWEIIEEGETGKGAKFTITIPKLNKSGKENFQLLSTKYANTHLIGDNFCVRNIQ